MYFTYQNFHLAAKKFGAFLAGFLPKKYIKNAVFRQFTSVNFDSKKNKAKIFLLKTPLTNSNVLEIGYLKHIHLLQKINKEVLPRTHKSLGNF